MWRRIMAVLLALTICVCGFLVVRESGFLSSSLPASQTSSLHIVQADNAPAQEEIDFILSELQQVAPKRPVDETFLRWGCEAVSLDFTERLCRALENTSYYDDLFYDLFGISLLAMYDSYTGDDTTQSNIHTMSGTNSPLTLAFTGDINLADTWENMLVLAQQANGISDCLSEPLLARMRQADILLVNNEFTFSNRGTAMAGKQYTFRAKPENVQILEEMGVDIVSLANNHVFDYGEDAFLDTLDTLTNAQIPFVGAGHNIEEASLPQYFIVGGIKIAYVTASRAEKYILTPEATETEPGILRTYDSARFLAAVKEAVQNADLVIAYPHWGTENTTRLEDAQITLGHDLIDAGADVVIGAHPHCLQGIEYYNEKPIVYSLGNFWFNTATVDTALLELRVHSPSQIEVIVQPCLQKGGKTTLLEEESERQRIFSLLESISNNISISQDGTVLAQQSS